MSKIRHPLLSKLNLAIFVQSMKIPRFLDNSSSRIENLTKGLKQRFHWTGRPRTNQDRTSRCFLVPGQKKSCPGVPFSEIMTRLSVLEHPFSVLEPPFLFQNIPFCFRKSFYCFVTSFSCFRKYFSALSRFVPQDGTGQAVKILYHPLPCPVLNFDLLSSSFPW